MWKGLVGDLRSVSCVGDILAADPGRLLPLVTELWVRVVGLGSVGYVEVGCLEGILMGGCIWGEEGL